VVEERRVGLVGGWRWVREVEGEGERVEGRAVMHLTLVCEPQSHLL
jgi:hypothetical protein